MEAPALIVVDEHPLAPALVAQRTAEPHRQEPRVREMSSPAGEHARAVHVGPMQLARHVVIIDAIAESIEPTQHTDLERDALQRPTWVIHQAEARVRGVSKVRRCAGAVVTVAVDG